MGSDLAPDPSAVPIRLATVTGVACGTALPCAFPDTLPARGVCADKRILLSLVILPESEVTARAPPQEDSTYRMPPSHLEETRHAHRARPRPHA